MQEIKSSHSLNDIISNNLLNYDFLSDWLSSQRWSGLKNIYVKNIKIIETIELKTTSDKFRLVLVILKCNTKNLNKIRSYKFFIPFIISSENNQNSIFKLICEGGTYFFSYANHYLEYYQIMYSIFSDEDHNILSNNQGLDFSRASMNSWKSEVIDFEILGEGDTTNCVSRIKLKNNKNLIIKEYRRIKKRREVQFLKFLNENEFKLVPELFGVIELKLKDLSYNVGVFMEYISAEGDGGFLFWQNLYNNLKNLALDKAKFGNIENIVDFLENNSDFKVIIHDLSLTIKKFHQKMNNFDDKLEYFNNNDITFKEKNVQNIINQIEIKVENKNVVKNNKFFKKLYNKIFTKSKYLSKIQEYRESMV
ncbi:MAG: hypothetical protein GF329_21820, partial [Candidatus Lokiarchaeota archaeon]|nr:hypothetical protein [Candidatus Lokiarchaeota archaeon]